MTATYDKPKAVRHRTNFSKVIIEVEGKLYWFSLTRQGVVVRRWHGRKPKLLSFSDHFGDWPGDDVAAVKFQSAIDTATKFQVESFFVGLAEAAGKPVGSFKTGGEWIDHIKGELAEKDKRIAEARNLIKHFGWTSCEDTAVMRAAEKWLEGKP